MDYIIVNRKTKKPYKFENGDIVIFGNKKEAIEDCQKDEQVVVYEDK